MKKVLLFILLGPLLANAQRGTATKNKTQADSIQSKDTIRQSALTLPDTVVVPMKDSAAFGIHTNSKATIYLVKQPPEKPDLFRYWFPIFTLFLGMFITQGVDAVKRLRKYLRVGPRWIAEGISYQHRVSQQVDHIDSLLHKTGPDIFDIPELTMVTSAADGLNSLNKDDLVGYLRAGMDLRDAVDRANGFHTSVNVLINLSASLKAVYEKHIELHGKYTQDVASKILPLKTKVGTWIQTELKNNPPADVFEAIEYIEKLFDEFFVPGQTSTDLFELNDEFFAPLRIAFRNEPSTQLTLEILDILGQIQYAIQSIQMEKKYLHKDMTELRSRYVKTNNQFVEVIKGILNRIDGHTLLFKLRRWLFQ